MLYDIRFLKKEFFNVGLLQIGGGNIFEIQNDESPYDFSVYDGTNRLTISAQIPAFTTIRHAVSLTDAEMRLSVNGTSNTGPHDGTLLSESKFPLGLGRQLFRSIIYYPRALPESTLNTLTS
jgi:hypothetical protein